MDPYGGLPADSNMGMMSGMSGPPGMAAGAQTDQASDPFQRIIDAVRSAVEEDGTVTAQEMLIVEQITTLVAKLRAGRDKEQQAMLGGGPATQGLARIFGGR